MRHWKQIYHMQIRKITTTKNKKQKTNTSRVKPSAAESTSLLNINDCQTQRALRVSAQDEVVLDMKEQAVMKRRWRGRAMKTCGLRVA